MGIATADSFGLLGPGDGGPYNGGLHHLRFCRRARPNETGA